MSKVLKMTFQFADNKTVSYNLAEPRADIDGAEVEAAMQLMLTKEAISVNGVKPVAIKEAVIREVSETPII